MTRENQLIYDALCEVLVIAKERGGYYQCNYSIEEIRRAAEKYSKEDADNEQILDEAANNYAGGSSSQESVMEIAAFRAGAEWMAEQGETIEGSLGYGPHLQRLIIALKQVPKIWDGHCQDVTVQIRKK